MIKNKEEAKELFHDYDITEALKNDEPHDIIHEIADSNIDVYYQDQLNWLGFSLHHADSVQEALEEHGMPKTAEGTPNFWAMVSQGQLMDNKSLLWEAWEELKAEDVKENEKLDNVTGYKN